MLRRFIFISRSLFFVHEYAHECKESIFINPSCAFRIFLNMLIYSVLFIPRLVLSYVGEEAEGEEASTTIMKADFHFPW